MEVNQVGKNEDSQGLKHFIKSKNSRGGRLGECIQRLGDWDWKLGY